MTDEHIAKLENMLRRVRSFLAAIAPALWVAAWRSECEEIVAAIDEALGAKVQ